MSLTNTEIDEITTTIFESIDDLICNAYCDIDKQCENITSGIDILTESNELAVRQDVIQEMSDSLVFCPDLGSGALALAYLHYDLVEKYNL
jgi:hypothetical protein